MEHPKYPLPDASSLDESSVTLRNGIWQEVINDIELVESLYASRNVTSMVNRDYVAQKIHQQVMLSILGVEAQTSTDTPGRPQMPSNTTASTESPTSTYKWTPGMILDILHDMHDIQKIQAPEDTHIQDGTERVMLIVYVPFGVKYAITETGRVFRYRTHLPMTNRSYPSWIEIDPSELVEMSKGSQNSTDTTSDDK